MFLTAAEPLSFQVEVVAPQDPPMYNKSFSLRCASLSTDSFIPVAYKWFKNNIELTNPSAATSSLRFDSLKLSDVGEYQCEVTSLKNDVKASSVTYELSFQCKFVAYLAEVYFH